MSEEKKTVASEEIKEEARELTPDELAKVTGGQAAGPSSYGMTDTMGRMHSATQFAGSSAAPASCTVEDRVMRDAKMTEIYEQSFRQEEG